MHQTIKRRSFLRLALAGLTTSLTSAGCVRVSLRFNSRGTTSVAQTVGSFPEREGISADRLSVRPTPTPTPATGAEAEQPPLPASTMPEHILAPRIGLDAQVVEVGWERVQEQGQGQWYSRWRTASGAAGFHKGSPFPGGLGNIVISGHHNIDGRVFEHIHRLEPGNLVSLVADDVRYDYVVEERLLLREKGVSEEQRRQNAAWIAPTRDSRLTLVTCWPATGNDYRIVVVARPKADAQA